MWPFGCCPYLYKCGGIAPIKATDAMTQPVGQRNGQLFTEPTGGGGDGAYFVTAETKKSEIESALESGSIIVMLNDDHIMYATSKRRNNANTGDLYVFAACDIYVTTRYLYTCEAVFFDNDTGNIISSVFSLPIEKMGNITIGGTEYAATRKALAITENGVTTTYYVADIT